MSHTRYMDDFVGSNFYSKSVDNIKAAARQKALLIAHGGLDTLSDYKHECGVIKGLDLALSILEDTFKQLAAQERQ